MTTARHSETHVPFAGDTPQPTPDAKPMPSSVEGEVPGSSQPTLETHTVPAAAEFLDLRIWAESFHDAQENRKALVNRMERGGVDAALLEGHRSQLETSEHAFKLAMVRSYRLVVRTHMPAVEEWQKASFGIGEHLLARLLGHLGHPLVATPYVWQTDAPDGHNCDPDRCGDRHLVALKPFTRTVGQLWQYCGHGAPAKRRKGMSQAEAFELGSPSCKMLVHLLAEATIKCQPQPIDVAKPKMEAVGATSTPQPKLQAKPNRRSVGGKYYYRAVYDQRKAATEGRRFNGCTTCKGDTCSDGHRHADALRIVGKEILRDLWTHAQRMLETQAASGVGGPS